MRGGTIHGRTSFVILCNVSTKRNGQWTITHTLLYAYTDIVRWKSKDFLTYNASVNSIHADQLSNAISPPSLRKNNIKYLGERIKKEVVIIRIERYFSAFH